MDGRLLGPAVGAWLGAVLVGWWADAAGSVQARQERALALLAGLGVAALVLVATGWLLRRLIAVRPGRGTGVALSVAALGLGVLACAIPVAVWSAAPVNRWIDTRATAEVQATVMSEAVVRSPPVGRWFPARAEVRVRTTTITARGVRVVVSVPLVVRAPSGAQVPPPGSAVALTGRLGPLPTRSGAAGTLTVSTRTAWRVDAPPGPVAAAAQAMRDGLRASLRGAPVDAASLVAGLAVGDESRQPDELAADMRASGLAHLTAVSGGNVAIVLGAVLAVAAALRLPLAARAAVALASLAYFVVLVGPQPSVLRAAAMGAVAVLALLVGGRRAGPAVLAAAVLVLVLVEPWLARSWAFALSAGATAGIVLLVPRLSEALLRWPVVRRSPPALAGALALTIAAQLATLPILLAMGGAAGWVAVPANLAAMPVVPAVTVLGLGAALLAPVVPGAAALLAQAAAWPASWIALVARTAAGLPGAGVSAPAGWGAVTLTVLLALAGWVLVMAHRRLPGDRVLRRRALLGGAVLVSVLVVLRPPDRAGWPPPGWVMIMCDVGQGDALLLRSGPASAVVVDAGPDPDVLDRCLDDAGVTGIPLIVLTHFHADHVRGLAGAFRNRPVAQVRATGVREPAELADEVDAVLARQDQPLLEAGAGQVLVVGDLTIRALWPRRRIASGSVPNNASVVLDVSAGAHRLLLLGDVEPEAQVALEPDLRAVRFDVVKVPHHGSRYQAPELPQWARAPVALVSVGAGNDYGHPAPETIDAWAAVGALVARTDRDGDVAVVGTGSGLGVVTRDGMLPSP